MSYQVTMNVADSEEEARAAFGDYISKYYPELSQAMDLGNWGPVGTPGPHRGLADAPSPTRASTTSSAASARIDQFGQVERFAREILPRFAAERVR